jgi:hypothetical protein
MSGRRLAPRRKMSLQANPDGSVTIAPDDPDNQIIVMGDPSSGAVEVIKAAPVEKTE